MIRLATRASALARWQAEHVAGLLSAAGQPSELVLVSTQGDRDLSSPLWQIGGSGLFAKEVQAAVLDGRADVAVHSAKDLPASFGPDGLVLAAVPERGDPRDALIGTALADLAEGAVVATGSVRRRAQLAHLRPDLSFVSLRGNIATRIERAAAHAAAPMALVALQRLGLEQHVAGICSTAEMLPQVGQGALALECRAGDEALVELLGRVVDHPPTRRAVETERAFLAGLGEGCELPLAAHAQLVGDEIIVEGMVASLDGRVVLRDERRGIDPVELGSELAAELIGRGAESLLRSS